MITDLSNFYSLKNFRLQVLEASNNRVARLNPESFPESLVHVLLDGNQISEIEPDSISHLEHLQSVDLRFNKIQHLTSDALTTSYKNVNGKKSLVIISSVARGGARGHLHPQTKTA
jgi:Leucine-rich repeat (LRR) protein